MAFCTNFVRLGAALGDASEFPWLKSTILYEIPPRPSVPLGNYGNSCRPLAPDLSDQDDLYVRVFSFALRTLVNGSPTNRSIVFSATRLKAGWIVKFELPTTGEGVINFGFKKSQLCWCNLIIIVSLFGVAVAS